MNEEGFMLSYYHNMSGYKFQYIRVSIHFNYCKAPTIRMNRSSELLMPKHEITRLKSRHQSFWARYDRSPIKIIHLRVKNSQRLIL